MDKSYLIELLRTFKNEDFEELTAFISSPYFAKGKMGHDAQNLLRIIKSEAQGLNPEDIKKEFIYGKLYPGEEVIEGKIEKAMSELYKISKYYLLTKDYFSESNEFDNLLRIAKIYRIKNIDQRYLQTINKLEALQNAIPKKNAEFYLNQYFLEYEKCDYESYNNLQRGNLNIPNVIYNLDVYYYIAKFELIIQFIFQSHATKIEIPEAILHNVKNLSIPDQYLSDYPILRINYRFLLILTNTPPTIQDLEDLVKDIENNESNLDQLVLRTFSAHLRNIGVINDDIIPGIKQFNYEIRKEHLKKGYLYYQDKLPAGGLLGLVRNGIRYLEFDWTLKLIEDHKHLTIGENETFDYYRLAKAMYFFALKQFEQALEILPLTFNESIYTNLARGMELQIYYELSSDLLSYKLDAFKMYVARTAAKHAPTNEQIMQTNFINILIQLATSSPNDKKRSEQIIRRIHEKKLLANKDWLLEKAGALAP